MIMATRSRRAIGRPAVQVQEFPAWRQGAVLNEFFQISGTSGADGSAIDAYSGFALDDATSRIIIACAGGHNNSGDNRVVDLYLSADSPSWRTLKAQSTPTVDVLYYGDGTPTSRHTYQYIHHIPTRDVVVLPGCQAGYGGNTPTGAYMDSFDLATNTWGTLATLPNNGANPPQQTAGYGGFKDRLTGDIWTTGLAKWSNATNAWSLPITTYGGATVRFPNTHDTLRNQMFGLQWGDGQGTGSGVVAQRVPLTGATHFVVTFNASAGLTAFQNATPMYLGMDYDRDNDRFLVYHDNGSAAPQIFIVTPNNTNVWDIAMFSYGAGNQMPPAGPGDGSGVQNRFKYVPNLKGFAVLPKASSNLYFMRTT